MPQSASHSDTHPHATGSSASNFTPWRRFAWRDTAIVLLTAALWVAVTATNVPMGIEVTCGILTGLCALQFHEWGHLYGGLRSGAAIYPPRRLTSPFLFGIDHTNTNRDQFLSLTWPAFTATALYFLGFLVLLPHDQTAGKVALAMGSISAALTVLIEFPIAGYVFRTGKIPNTALFKPPAV